MRKVFTIIALVAGGMLLGACEMYEDGRPSKTVRSEFKSAYPEARDIEWERVGSFWVCSFETGNYPNEIDHESWYNEDGKWLATLTSVSLSGVPQEFKTSLGKSEYGTATFEDDDAEFVETPAGNFYRFDVEFNAKEIDLDVYPDGDVILADRFIDNRIFLPR